MTKDEKMEIISNEGFTDFQTAMIYDEMNCSKMETEEELIDAANEWWDNQMTLERCGL